MGILDTAGLKIGPAAKGVMLHDPRKVAHGARHGNAFVHQALLHKVIVGGEKAQNPVAPPVAVADAFTFEDDLAADLVTFYLRFFGVGILFNYFFDFF